MAKQHPYYVLVIIIQLPWTSLVGSLFDGADINADTKVLVQSPTYFRLLDDMLQNETQSHTIKRWGWAELWDDVLVDVVIEVY